MPRQVLVIDDSTSIRMLVTLALERAGFDVQQAEDGEAAIELLDGRPLDAIVCDLAMPRMDGRSFLRWLRQHPRYRTVPLLVLSTETRVDVRTSLRIQGAQAFMSKPCRPGDLVDAVLRLCDRKVPATATADRVTADLTSRTSP